MTRPTAAPTNAGTLRSPAHRIHRGGAGSQRSRGKSANRAADAARSGATSQRPARVVVRAHAGHTHAPPRTRHPWSRKYRRASS